MSETNQKTRTPPNAHSVDRERPLNETAVAVVGADFDGGVSCLRGCGLSDPTLRQELPMAAISPLPRRMIDDMMVRNLSPSTQQSYIYAVAKFSRHFDRSPDRLGLEDVRAYQLHLIAQKRSWSHLTRRSAHCGSFTA